MQNIEQELHTLLREIDPKNAFSREEQNKIIAHAASIFTCKHNKRLATKMDTRTLQGHMNDAILKAMASLNDWDDYEEEYIDIQGLSSRQALRKVANSSKSKWGLQTVLNPDVIEDLDLDEDKDDPKPEQELENAQQTSEALKTPGVGRHRSDFISAPLR
jgi:hypothetical protein